MKINRLCLLPLVAALAVAAQRADAETVAVPKPSANLELARQLNQAFVEVAQEVSPAVVVITVTQKVSANHLGDFGDQSDEEDPLEQFRRFFRHQSQPQAPAEKSIGQGSGVIIRPDGYILTNRHVVEDAEKIEVRLQDGRTFTAKIRGVDAPADVAVIKIEAANLTVAKLADSDQTRVGEFAIAIGSPFALDYSVTFGHVSAKDRSNIFADGESPSGMQDQNFIQTDANINPGNSGGPLVNIDGEVIGINTLIRGLHTGIGFAIPINLAKTVADQLISEGKYSRSYLGIQIKSLKEDAKFREWMDGLQDGVIVEEIVPKGPASKSKLHAADVITAVDGKPVTTSQQLKDAIRSKKVGQDVTLDVVRKSHDASKPFKITVKPEVAPDEMEVATEEMTPTETAATHNVLGLSVKTLTPDLARKYNVDMADGVIVTGIDKDGLGAQNGIQEGDIITSIDDHAITNPRQFKEVTRNVDVKKGALVHLITDGSAKFEVIKQGAQ